MRTSRRQKQSMFYSNFREDIPIYERDSEGNIIYRTMPDGEEVPVTNGDTIKGYDTPVEFFNSITATLTEEELQAFGGEKKAVAKMTYHIDQFPFKVGTLIWKKSPVGYDGEGNVDPESADYRVMGILDEGRLFYRAIMEKVTKGENA